MQGLAILFILVTSCVGLLQVLFTIHGMDKVLERVEDFLVKLKEYVSSGGNDLKAYEWLVENSDWLQAYLGDMGIAAAYKAPYASHIITNYPIIVNTLPELRQSIEHSSRSAREHYMTLRETVIRYRGVLGVRKEKLITIRINPVRWFLEGIKWILSIPFIILSWAGVLSSGMVSRIEQSFLFKFIATIFAIVGFISSVLTIAVEWDTIAALLNKFFK